MAKILKQFYYKVPVINNNGSISEQTLCPNGETGFADFFGQEFLTNGSISHKISIQGPPGLVIELNHKSLILGRSGIYDFDNQSIDITSIQIPKPQTYKRIEDSAAAFAAAEQVYDLYNSIGSWMSRSLSEPSSSSWDSQKEEYDAFCQTGREIENTKYEIITGSISAIGFNLLDKYIEIRNGVITTEDNTNITNITVNFIEESDENQGGV